MFIGLFRFVPVLRLSSVDVIMIDFLSAGSGSLPSSIQFEFAGSLPDAPTAGKADDRFSQGFNKLSGSGLSVHYVCKVTAGNADSGFKPTD